MAVKWAVANGNWSAGATWNDGVVPTSGDYVYLNGKTLSHTTNINIGIGTITNASNVDLSIVAGGILNINANNSNDLTITANLIQSGSAPLLYLNRQVHPNLTTFIGDIENDQTYAVDILENNNKISVIGNLTISNVGLFYTHNPYSNVTELFTITGTVNGSGKLLADNSCNIANLSIVGNAKYDIGNSLVGNLQKLSVTGIFAMQSNITIPTIEVDGVYRVDNNSLTTCTTFTINGGIEYTSANNNIGVKYTTLNIINNTTFTWKDISEPRLNPFIIVTNADMNNRQQYPPEDEVKQGTEYVWGEKVGTYLPDYPPEANVLQGVTYDNGNKTGTLNIPSTSDIVTAIKSDSDLGGKIASTDTNVSDIKSRLGSVNSGTIGSVVDTINTNTQSLSTDLAVVDGNVDIIVSRLTQNLVDRLGNSVTVQLLQQVLDAHLND